jgi:hypothetical protein
MNVNYCKLLSDVTLTDITHIAKLHRNNTTYSLKFTHISDKKYNVVVVPIMADFLVGTNKPVELYFSLSQDVTDINSHIHLGFFTPQNFPKLYLRGLYGKFCLIDKSPDVNITLTFELVSECRKETISNAYKKKQIAVQSGTIEYDHGIVRLV